MDLAVRVHQLEQENAVLRARVAELQAHLESCVCSRRSPRGSPRGVTIAGTPSVAAPSAPTAPAPRPRGNTGGSTSIPPVSPRGELPMPPSLRSTESALPTSGPPRLRHTPTTTTTTTTTPSPPPTLPNVSAPGTAATNMSLDGNGSGPLPSVPVLSTPAAPTLSAPPTAAPRPSVPLKLPSLPPPVRGLPTTPAGAATTTAQSTSTSGALVSPKAIPRKAPVNPLVSPRPESNAPLLPPESLPPPPTLPHAGVHTPPPLSAQDGSAPTLPVLPPMDASSNTLNNLINKRKSVGSGGTGRKSDREDDTSHSLSGLPAFEVDGRCIVSAMMLRVMDDADVRNVVGYPNRLHLNVVGIEETKTQWFLIKVTIVSPAGLPVASWIVARQYSTFQMLMKALPQPVNVELPSVKALAKGKQFGVAERVSVMNAFVMDLCRENPEVTHSSPVLLRFVDPFNCPSAVGLRILRPHSEGMVELTIPKEKGKTYFCVLYEHFFYFKTEWDDAPVGSIYLEYCMLDLVHDPSYPRFSMSITNPQKETWILSFDSTKSLSEWVLRFREAKFGKSGTFAVYRSGEQPPAIPPLPALQELEKVKSRVKEMFVSFLSQTGGAADLGKSELVPETVMTWNPLSWDFATPDSSENLVAGAKEQGGSTSPRGVSTSPRSGASPSSTPPTGSGSTLSTQSSGNLSGLLDRSGPIGLSRTSSAANFYEDAPALNIREATVQKLVEKLFDEKATNPQFVMTFMTTFRYWMRPLDLFKYFCRQFFEQQRLRDRVQEGGQSSIPQLRLMLILRYWVRYHFYDFLANVELGRLLLQLLRDHLIKDAGLQLYTNIILKDLKAELGLPLGSSAPPPNSILPPIYHKEIIELIDLSPLEVARQLTLIEFGLFSAIDCCELTEQRWNSADKETLAPNVLKMIRRFNQTSFWVQLLLLRTPYLAARVHLLQFLVQVCQHLMELQCFSGVWEILSALRATSIRRLSDTFAALPEETTQAIASLTEIMDSSGSFKSYRAALNSTVGPSVPYLGIYLTDLTFSEESMQTKAGGQRMNFSKATVIGSFLNDILKRQKLRYNLKPQDFLMDYLQRLETEDEETLFKLSLQVQPRKDESK